MNQNKKSHETANDCTQKSILSLHYLYFINPLNAELNPICCLLALLGAHHFLHLSRI